MATCVSAFIELCLAGLTASYAVCEATVTQSLSKLTRLNPNYLRCDETKNSYHFQRPVAG